MAEGVAPVGVAGGGPPAGGAAGGDRAALIVFLVREAVGVCFVIVWLLLLLADVVTETYRVPFWLNCVGIGTLAFCLGINAADLTATRPPSRAGKAVVTRADA
jgi:hypothetical protein